ncbi:MAG TPA: thiolase family protein [Acidimicrobiia bacterium]|nr:thiolase family protein [Acidimicrobiia bacterium]
MKTHRVAIVGLGYSQVGRGLGLSERELSRQAFQAAIDDAGMQASDIDGITAMGGGMSLDIAYTLGMSPVNWYSDCMAGPAFVQPACQAIAAVASGYAHTVAAFRVINQMPSFGARGASDAPTPPRTAPGDQQFSAPFGSGASAATIGGWEMQRYMARFGATEEHFALNAVNQRYHASLNDDALLREPITVDDYFAARYISKPARLFDCDYPVDAGSVVIFTTEERARNWRTKPVFVEASALSAIAALDFALLPEQSQTAPWYCGEQLWDRTDLRASDVDVAELYDGFTIITFQWLEGLGFCGAGEAKDLVKEGHTRLGGSIPLNTDGGACNVGRRHGANFCIEATRQLRGECGERQVPGAEVAVWSNAVGPFGGVVLLTAN